jgi:hypothetical protein
LPDDLPMSQAITQVCLDSGLHLEGEGISFLDALCILSIFY